MPQVARAQQSGLFPLKPIKRQRVPCDQEDPVYKVYKEKYFGYHPPCWRPFPTGWGCPSPEKPDVEKSFKERKLGMEEQPEPGAAGDMPPEGDQPDQRPNRPALPAGRSPFEQPATNGDAPANPANPAQPRSPFDLDSNPAKPPGDNSATPKEGRNRPATSPTIGDGGPELSAPDQPPQVRGARTSRVTRDEATENDQEDGPLLALPNVTLPPVSSPDAPFGTQPAQAATVSDESAPVQTGSGSSSPRRGILSGLFNNLGLNWTRR